MVVCLFLPFFFALYQAKCAALGILLKKEEDPFTFGARNGLLTSQKPGHNQLIFFLLVRELFYSSETFSFLSRKALLFSKFLFFKDYVTP